MGGHIKRTVTALPLRGKTVLVRIDADVPIVHGRVDRNSLEACAKTLRYLMTHHARVIVIGHLSRPDSIDGNFSLQPVAQALADMLEKPVHFVDVAVGPKAKMAVKKAPYGSVVVLENLRFYKGEEQNSPDFAQELKTATGADYFIQDDRRAARHAWASTDAIAHIIPGFAGFNVLDVWSGPGVKSLLDA